MADLNRTPETEQAYSARAAQLFEAIGRSHQEHTGTAFGVKEFVDGFIAKNDTYRPSAWYFNRRSICFALAEKAKLEPALAGDIAQAIKRLKATPAAARTPEAARNTSSHRQKRFPPEDAEAVEHLALTRRTSTAPKLVKFLHSSLLTGLRPCEWPFAELSMTADPAAKWILHVQNAKRGNGRALGEDRELRWPDLPRNLVQDLADCIDLAQHSSYRRLRSTMSDLLADLTQKLWPKRTRRPDLYSARHEAIARWKARFLHPDQSIDERLHGLATIAALSGHATDETASRHYGRPRPGRDRNSLFPAPLPAPERVAEVRRTFDIGLLGRRMRPRDDLHY